MRRVLFAASLIAFSVGCVGPVSNDAGEKTLNVSSGKSYSVNVAPSLSYPDDNCKLTDGKINEKHWNEKQGVGWKKLSKALEIVIDLDKNVSVNKAGCHLAGGGSGGCWFPDRITVEASEDKKNWKKLGAIKNIPPQLGDINLKWLELYGFKPENARYVKFIIPPFKDKMRQWLMIDEIVVYSGDKASSQTKEAAASNRIIDVKAKDVDGQIKVVDIYAKDNLVDCTGSSKVDFDLGFKYEVLKKADVFLDSAWGMEYWCAYNWNNHKLSKLYSKERISLEKKGVFEVNVPVFKASDEILSKGLNVISEQNTFFIRDVKEKYQPNKYLGTCNTPFRLGQRLNIEKVKEIRDNLIFTVANLKKFSLSFSDFDSDWKAGGKFSVSLKVLDADNETFYLARLAKIQASVFDKNKNIIAATSLKPVFDPEKRRPPVFLGLIPYGAEADSISISAEATSKAPNGSLRYNQIKKTFSKDEYKSKKMEPQEAALPECKTYLYLSSSERTKERIDKIINKADKAHIYALSPNAYSLGRAYFRSEPLLPSLVENNFDSLAYMIKEAHKKGIKVIPFCFTGGIGRKTSFDINKYGKGGSPLARKHPEFLRTDEKGQGGLDAEGDELWACTHNKKFQKFIIDLYSHLAENYDIDGFFFDGIRTGPFCFCEKCRNEFKKRYGKELSKSRYDNNWKEWQAEGIDSIVEGVVEKVRKKKPNLEISATVCIPCPSSVQGQNPHKWLNNGWLDHYMTMNYKGGPLTHSGYQKNASLLAKDQQKAGAVIGLYDMNALKTKDVETVLREIRVLRSIGVRRIGFFESKQLYPELTVAIGEEFKKAKDK